MRNKWVNILAVLGPLLVLSLRFLLPAEAAANAPGVSIVSDGAAGAPVRHGLRQLALALREKGVECEEPATPEAARGQVLIVAGLANGSGPAAQWHKERNLPAPTEPESLVIQHGDWKGKEALLVSGADDRGLMYALLDVADRVGWAADPARPLSEVRNVRERPAVPERALSIYTMQRAYFESRFFDEKYWAAYFDLLARNRFNTFALIFGYENAGYFSPAYPYFFDVEGFPDVKVGGLSKEDQRRNLAALNRIIQMAHERGLNVTLGLWDHIYRGGVQAGGVKGADKTARGPAPGIPWGVTEKNLGSYTKAALAKFVREVHGIDALQFRMHEESGLKRTEMAAFWAEVFDLMKRTAPHIRCDLRAKGLPDSIIDMAVEKGLKFRIATKYWAEQMGMLFHPTHINRQNQSDRRHGYADMLRYPAQYKMHWRLWNGGTSRVLLWGDPDYVRRFAGSTFIYPSEGFEVNEPLATKMASHPHDLKPLELLRPDGRYYAWEFERYWHFFQVWGRVGYNPETPPEVWQREFERRFGKDAAPFLEQGLHRASQVLPRIVAAVFPYHRFPMTRGWAEKQRWEDLPGYARAEPSDLQQFLSMDEEAKNILEGGESAKTRPPETSRWLARTAAEVLQLVAEAEKQIGPHRSKEFVSTVTDLKILGRLALYHSHRLRAGVSYSLFKQAQDVNALDDAIAAERCAIQEWEKLVAAAGDVYADDLAMGLPSAGLSGHWRDELGPLKKGLQDLERQRDGFRPAAAARELTLAHVPVRKTPPDHDVVLRVTVGGPEAIKGVQASYRAGPGDYRTLNMEPAGPFRYRATIPAAAVAAGLNYFVEATDAAGRRVAWPREGNAHPLAVMATADDEPPAVVHKPVTRAPVAKPLTVTAQVADSSGVKWVRLLYRSVNQHQDYQALPMLPTAEKDTYQASVPAAMVGGPWDLMYLIEVMDNAGNGKIYPDMEKETPYVVVRLERGAR